MEITKVFKVHDDRRQRRKGIVSSSYIDLVQKCKERFELDNGIFKLVLDKDGYELDAEFFTILPDMTELMILSGEQAWQVTKGEEIIQPVMPTSSKSIDESK